MGVAFPGWRGHFAGDYGAAWQSLFGKCVRAAHGLDLLSKQTLLEQIAQPKSELGFAVILAPTIRSRSMAGATRPFGLNTLPDVLILAKQVPWRQAVWNLQPSVGRLALAARHEHLSR